MEFQTKSVLGISCLLFYVVSVNYESNMWQNHSFEHYSDDENDGICDCLKIIENENDQMFTKQSHYVALATTAQLANTLIAPHLFIAFRS